MTEPPGEALRMLIAAPPGLGVPEAFPEKAAGLRIEGGVGFNQEKGVGAIPVERTACAMEGGGAGVSAGTQLCPYCRVMLNKTPAPRWVSVLCPGSEFAVRGTWQGVGPQAVMPPARLFHSWAVSTGVGGL